MTGKRWHLLLCGLLAAPMLGAPPPQQIGTVVSGGEIRIDGTPVPSGAVLFSGDQIDTGRSSSALIYLPRNDKIAFGPSTHGRLTAANGGVMLQLDSGKVVTVSAAGAPIIVNARGLRIESKEENGSYEVIARGDSVEVLSRTGETLVRGANRTVSVPAGMVMKSVVDRGKRGATHGKILLVTLIAAAAGAGIGFGVTAPGATCVSPSQLNCP